MKFNGDRTRFLDDARGFTLVEVLIVMVISFLVMSAIFSVFNTQHTASVAQESQQEINSAINVSLDMMLMQIRAAGYRVPPFAAVNPFDNFGITGGTLAGHFEGVGATNVGLRTNATTGIKLGTDGVMVISTDNACISGNFVDTSGNHFQPSQTGATAYVCEPNCFSAGTYTAPLIGMVRFINGTVAQTNSIFLVKILSVSTGQAPSGGVCGGAGFTSVTYSQVDPSNLWDCLPAASGTRCLTTDPGAGISTELLRLENAHFYFVNRSNQLSRVALDTNAVAYAPQVIAENVEDLQIQYDLISTCTTGVGSWLTGCTRQNFPPSPSSRDMLSQIRGLRVGVVIRARAEDRINFINKGKSVNLFNHVPSPTTDSFRRKTITSLVHVRNLDLLDL